MIWLSFQLIAKNKNKQEEVTHDQRQDSSRKPPTEEKSRGYEQRKRLQLNSPEVVPIAIVERDTNIQIFRYHTNHSFQH